MKNSKDDPWLPEAQQAVQAFERGDASAESALNYIWARMDAATKAGFPSRPYVDLTERVNFPEEQRDVDPDKERAAAEWMAELQTREPEND